MLDSSPGEGTVAAETVIQPTNGEQPVVTEIKDGSTAESSSAPSSDAKGAESSPAKPKATMLDAVRAAIKPKEAAPASETPGKTADAANPDSKAKAEADTDLSAEEMAKLSDRTQRRIKKLNSDVKARDAEVARLSPKAAEFDKIDQFVRSAGLNNQEVSGTLEIAAMLKTDQRGALARLEPIVSALRELVGDTLSTELQQQVDQGFLTLAHAKTLQRATADAALATRRVSETTEAQRAEREQRDTQQLVTNTIGSIETWEAAKAKSDPDWNLKREEVAQGVELAILKESNRLNKKWFPNAEEAVKLSEDSLKEVNTRFSRFAPKPRSIVPVAPGGASNRSKPAPKSMLDVVRQTVAG